MRKAVRTFLLGLELSPLVRWLTNACVLGTEAGCFLTVAVLQTTSIKLPRNSVLPVNGSLLLPPKAALTTSLLF